MSATVKTSFAERLLAWFDRHGRSGLPWQSPRDNYRVWLSEIMLQQTQVAAVIPYFERFVARFPTVQALAEADSEEVMRHWAGLGYYARARNLHAAAKQVVQAHGGEFPTTLAAMMALPGVGRSTAAAILSQAQGQPQAILDGNVKRVLARWGGIEGWPGEPKVAQKLWALAESLVPPTRAADYTQAQMDLGATLCVARQPACTRCPLAGDCVAFGEQRVASLPTPRPKKNRPHREAWLILAEDENGRLLFEQRPGSGIWGGLWSPPVIALEDDRDTALLRDYGLQLAGAHEGEAIEHAFTHFDWTLRPWRGRAQLEGTVHESRAQQWRSAVEATQKLPLPAPLSAYFARTQSTLPLASHP